MDITVEVKLALVSFVICGAFGCASALPRPSLGHHPSTETTIVVPSKPSEPVQVDIVGKRPSQTAVWIDGQWEWRGRRWAWVAGSWQDPPPDSYYAPTQLWHWVTPVYGESGGADGSPQLVGFGMMLLYLPGHWHRHDGQIVEPTKK